MGLPNVVKSVQVVSKGVHPISAMKYSIGIDHGDYYKGEIF